MEQYIRQPVIRAVQAWLAEHGKISIDDVYTIRDRTYATVDEIEAAVEYVCGRGYRALIGQ